MSWDMGLSGPKLEMPNTPGLMLQEQGRGNPKGICDSVRAALQLWAAWPPGLSRQVLSPPPDMPTAEICAQGLFELSQQAVSPNVKGEEMQDNGPQS